MTAKLLKPFPGQEGRRRRYSSHICHGVLHAALVLLETKEISGAKQPGWVSHCLRLSLRCRVWRYQGTASDFYLQPHLHLATPAAPFSARGMNCALLDPSSLSAGSTVYSCWKWILQMGDSCLYLAVKCPCDAGGL